MPNPKFEYLPKQNQFRAKQTIYQKTGEQQEVIEYQKGQFVSPNSVIREGEIQITENNRFKLRGGSFVSKESITKREKEEKPYEDIQVGERLVFTDKDGNIDQIRIYSPQKGKQQLERAIIQQAIKKGILSEKEYQEFDGDRKGAADLVRERALFTQQVI